MMSLLQVNCFGMHISVLLHNNCHKFKGSIFLFQCIWPDCEDKDQWETLSMLTQKKKSKISLCPLDLKIGRKNELNSGYDQMWMTIVNVGFPFQ